MIGNFFEALFGDLCQSEKSALGISVNNLTEGRWRTFWFYSTEEAAEFALANSERTDANIYFHTVLHDCSNISHSQSLRGKSETATVASALWCDIDIAGDGHKKPGLVPSFEVLVERLKSVPLQPSVTVRTLGGVHLYWLLREPLDLTNAEEKARMTSTHKRLERALSDLGLRPDPTADHARVFRVPECRDNKQGRNGKVTVTELHAERRYDLSEIEEMLDTLGTLYGVKDEADHSEKPSKDQIVTARNGLTFNPDAKLPEELREWIDLQCQMDTKFNGTWVKRRPDLTDQSQSGYDMSLASLLVRHPTITDQQMVDVLIYYRRKRDPNGRQDKFNANYLMPMILQARAGARKAGEREREEASKLVTDEMVDRAKHGQSLDGGDTIGHLREILGLPGFGGIIKQVADPASIYKIRVAGTVHTLGTVESIIVCRQFKARIADICGQVIRADSRTWDNVAQLLIHPSVMTLEDLGEESDLVERVTGWVQDFILSRVSEERPMQTFEEFLERPSGHEREPFQKDGVIYLSAAELFNHLKIKTRLEVDRRTFYSSLKTAGLTPEMFNLTSRKSTCRAWGVPPEMARRLHQPDPIGSIGGYTLG